MQSPINIETTEHEAVHDVEFNYTAAPLDILNNGQTIKVCCEGAGSVTYLEQTYPLKQFHFHHPAEHTIDDEFYEIELHLVHEDETGHILVVAVMIEVGEKPHKTYATLWRHLPPLIDEEYRFSSLRVDPADLLPADIQHFYHYTGSLTTPPCTENVTWLIMSEPVQMSQKQVDIFAELYTGNNRPLQALNGREVYQHD